MWKFRLALAMAILMAAAFASGVLALQTGQAAPTFNLKDQFGKNWQLSSLTGSVTVVVAANKNSGRDMGPWVDKLKSTYGNKIQLLGLLDLHNIPGIGRGIAKSRIRSETKDPLMLDFNGATGKSYEANSKTPTVVVIDKNSIVKAIQKSDYTTTAFKSISSAIDTALSADK